MEVSRCLLDALSKEGLSARPMGKLGRSSAAQLTGFLQQFRWVWLRVRLGEA